MQAIFVTPPRGAVSHVCLDEDANPRKLDSRAREALILQYYPMVRRVAYRMVSRFPSCVDVDDLVNIGVMGLIDAVDRFEPDRSISFAGYARIRVQGAIVDEMRKNDWVPRSVRDRGDRIKDAKVQLAAHLGRDPTEPELATFLGVSEDRLRELNDGSTIHNVVSMDEGSGDDHTLGDVIACLLDGPESIVESASLRTRVRDSIATLPDRDKMIVELYYFRELGFKEIGEKLGVTESRISQLHTRIMERLRAKLASVADER